MSKGCGCCVGIRNDRKDFRRDHGGGPEEMPHRKKGGKKRKPRKREDHKHLWETNGWEKRYAIRHVRRESRDIWGGWWKQVEDKTKWYFVRRYECLVCGKAGKIQYDYPKGRRYFYYA